MWETRMNDDGMTRQYIKKVLNNDWCVLRRGYRVYLMVQFEGRPKFRKFSDIGEENLNENFVNKHFVLMDGTDL